MNKLHKEVVDLFKKENGTFISKNGKDYIGSTKPGYDIKTATAMVLIKKWIKEHPNITFSDFLHLLGGNTTCNCGSGDKK